MNWVKAWNHALYVWIVLIIFNAALYYFFYHCNCLCYWTNDLAKAAFLPSSLLFLGLTFFLIPFGIVVDHLENKKQSQG